jgi:membrane carboxypeptidase/penicillin-binding protein
VLGHAAARRRQHITQQLARKLFLTDEVSLERKIKEWMLAIQIDKRYTKPKS